VDDLNSRKTKLAMLTKKDGGNLTVRDYTDDIYNSGKLNQGHFIEGKLKFDQVSESFGNMLVVVPKNKLAGFSAELKHVMNEYYEALDKAEANRVADTARSRLHEMRENEKAFAQFLEAANVGHPPAPFEKNELDPENENKKKAHDE